MLRRAAIRSSLARRSSAASRQEKVSGRSSGPREGRRRRWRARACGARPPGRTRRRIPAEAEIAERSDETRIDVLPGRIHSRSPGRDLAARFHRNDQPVPDHHGGSLQDGPVADVDHAPGDRPGPRAPVGHLPGGELGGRGRQPCREEEHRKRCKQAGGAPQEVSSRHGARVCPSGGQRSTGAATYRRAEAGKLGHDAARSLPTRVTTSGTRSKGTRIRAFCSAATMALAWPLSPSKPRTARWRSRSTV